MTEVDARAKVRRDRCQGAGCSPWPCWSPAGARTRIVLVVANESDADAPLQNPAANAEIVAASLEQADFKVTTAANVDLAGFDAVGCHRQAPGTGRAG